MDEAEPIKNMATVTFTPEKLRAFRKAYNKCTTDVFEFEGHPYVKGYAKYVIEYLEGKFNANMGK